jgi:hypothetical protein
VIAGPAHRRILSVGLACAVQLGAGACADPASTAAPSGASTASPSTTAGSEGGPDLTSVGFSTGGEKCELGDSATTFAVGEPVRAVLTMEPALPTGGTVKVMVEKDGVEVVEGRQTITVTEPAPCIHGTMRDLEVGHYKLTYTITPSQMMPATGEFDVTP